MASLVRRLALWTTSAVGCITIFDLVVLRPFFGFHGDEGSPLAKLRGMDGKGWKKVHVWSGSAQLPTADTSNTNATIPWQSQCGQDKLLVQEIFADKPTNRFFIDLASNDAVYLSNSYALETAFDWKGICIEANPAHYLGLAKRKCTVVAAVVNDKVDEEVVFNFQPDVKQEDVNPDFPPHLFGGIASRTTDNLNVARNHVKFRTTTLGAVLDHFHAPGTSTSTHGSLRAPSPPFRLSLTPTTHPPTHPPTMCCPQARWTT